MIAFCSEVQTKLLNVMSEPKVNFFMLNLVVREENAKL
jgi:hypothetical protein